MESDFICVYYQACKCFLWYAFRIEMLGVDPRKEIPPVKFILDLEYHLIIEVAKELHF